MADVRRPPALALNPPALALLLGLGASAARFDPGTVAVEDLELERAGQRVRLAEAQVERVADRVACPGVLADEGARSFVVAKVLAAERADRDQPVAAESDDRGEKAKALHPGD